MADKIYQFQYTVLMIEARISDGFLTARMGLKQLHIDIDSIEHVYLDNRKHRDSVELIISYYDKRKTLRRARLFSDHEETGLMELYHEILDRRPKVALVMLDPDEAYLVLGSKPAKWAAIPSVMLGAFVAVALACTPLFIHGTDDGLFDAHIDAFRTEHAPASRNLKITGATFPFDLSVTEKFGVGDDPEMLTTWVPMVHPTWVEGQPVELILQFRVRELDAIQNSKSIEGVLRNVWWEGPSGRLTRLFREKGVELSKTAWLVEANVHGRDDLKLAILILSILAVPLIGVTLTLRSRSRLS